MTNSNDTADTLTKREYFAAQIAQGMWTDPGPFPSASTVAANAIKAADALVEALNGHVSDKEGPG